MEDTYLTNIKEEELDGDIRIEDTNIADIIEEFEEDISIEDIDATNIKDEELDQISIEDICRGRF